MNDFEMVREFSPTDNNVFCLLDEAVPQMSCGVRPSASFGTNNRLKSSLSLTSSWS